MRRIQSDHPEAAATLATTLSREGVAVVPTDTIYGLSAPLSSRSGYQRILDIKRCSPGRRFLHLASSVDMVQRYIDSWGCGSKRLLAAIWPAPLTGVFRSGDKCPEWVGETIAFRVAALPLLARAIDILGEPVVSTSVNVTGGTPLDDIEQIEERVGGHVELIVESAVRPEGRPSTIVDFTGVEPVVVRAGAYDWTGDPGDGKPSN
jgi:L-threonylcarbamoyladenylate synthase